MQYDEWTFYQTRFKRDYRCCDANIAGTKAMDILALAPDGRTLWMIEAKDYRRHKRTKTITIWDEVAQKARDTLAGLFAASINANNSSEQTFARASLKLRRIRVVLHIEQPRKPSKLFPMSTTKANLKMKLKKQLHGTIDAHPIVMDCNDIVLGWSTAWTP